MAKRKNMNVFDEKTELEHVKDVLSTLRWWEKIEYLLHHYGWMLVIPVVAVALVIGAVNLFDNITTETVYRGTVVNVNLTTEGWAYLNEGYLAELGYTEKDKCIVDAYPTVVDDPEADNFILFAFTAEISAGDVIRLVEEQILDYLIASEFGLNHYLEQGWVAPVDQVLTAEQTERLKDRFFYYTDAEGNRYPAAVDISGIAFLNDHATNVRGPVYLFFPGNTDRPQLTHQFVDYLLAYGT